tara:strand:- start:2251 stop:2970 length:720 start_codon:yes stop_codon:yes gene_type:complete
VTKVVNTLPFLLVPGDSLFLISKNSPIIFQGNEGDFYSHLWVHIEDVSIDPTLTWVRIKGGVPFSSTKMLLWLHARNFYRAKRYEEPTGHLPPITTDPLPAKVSKVRTGFISDRRINWEKINGVTEEERSLYEKVLKGEYVPPRPRTKKKKKKKNTGNRSKNTGSKSTRRRKTTGILSYYAVLGAKAGNKFSTIKKKFKKLAFEHHPDRNKNNPDSEKRFKEINHAFNEISKVMNNGKN